MPRFNKDRLLPLLVILSSSFSAWLINQLPTKQDLQKLHILISDPLIFGLTGGCIALQIILAWSSIGSQSNPLTNSAPQNQNWLGGFLPLIGGITLYSLLKNNLVPAELSTVVSSVSQLLFILGILLPPVLLVPEQKRWLRVLFLLGAGLFISIHFILSLQWPAAVLSLFLTGIWVLLIFGGELIRKKLEEIEDRFPVWVGDLRGKFKKEYYQHLEDTYGYIKTEGLNTGKRLELQKVFVSLKVVPEDPKLVNPRMIPQVKCEANNQKEKDIWEILAEMGDKPEYLHMAVLGAPGSGKTTLLKHLTFSYAAKKQPCDAPKLIPVLLFLREVYQDIVKQSPPLAELITDQVECRNLPSKWFAEKLSQKKCLVMLDGLDEVADENQRQKVSSWVEEQMRAYPHTPFILTSRPTYKNVRRKQELTVFEVQQFSLKQIKEFIRNWYSASEKIPKCGEDAEQKADDLIQSIKNSSSLAALAVNPLLLTMIVTVHLRKKKLPEERVELYKEICQVVLDDRQEEKGLSDPLTAAQKQLVLQVLALALMQRQTREFSLDEGASLIKDKLNEVAREAGSTVEPKEFLEQIKQVCALLVEKQQLGVYEFAHLSFQEYLAAVEIKRLKQENLLIQNINTTWWAETILLYAAQSNASNLIRAVLDWPSPSDTTVQLAYDCLEESGEKVELAVQQQLTDDFPLTADMRLSQRLKKKLLRVDENREIDMHYITCMEYQLFIDEKQKVGEHRQPIHWETDKFTSEKLEAETPIAGVRASDAEAFCEWLKQKYFEQGVKYRLPSRAEAEEFSVTEKHTENPMGYWCIDGGEKAIIGIKSDQLTTWNKVLTYVWNRDCEAVTALANPLVLNDGDTYSLRDLAAQLDKYCDFGIKNALDGAGIYSLTEKHANQLNNNKMGYFQPFNPNSIHSNNKVCELNVSHLTHDCNNTIRRSKAEAEKKVLETNTQIKDIQKQLKGLIADLGATLPGELKECQNKHDDILKEPYANLDKINEEHRKAKRKIEKCKTELQTAHEEVRNIEGSISSMEADSSQRKLTETRNRVIHLEKEYIQEQALANIKPLKGRLTEARKTVVGLEQTRGLTNTELTKAREQVIKLEGEYEKALADAEPCKRKQTETYARVSQLESNREQEKASINDHIKVKKNERKDTEQRRKELNEDLKRYEKIRTACDNILSLTTTSKSAYLLFIIFIWDLLSRKDKKDEAWNFYAFHVLLDARREGKIPAWEGIRIVREKVQE